MSADATPPDFPDYPDEPPTEDFGPDQPLPDDWDGRVRLAEEALAVARKHLPTGLASAADSLPVLFQPWPGDEAPESGILGLALGAEPDPGFHMEGQGHPEPKAIYLYLESIAFYVEETRTPVPSRGSNAEQEAFMEEVAATYIHELGHHLGLDEDALWDRGIG
ncbi:MAG: metallopeptidase family protein [Opitutales bacterium]